MAASTETKSKTNKNGKSAPAERLEHKKGKDNEQTTGTTVVQPNDDLARLPADALVPPFEADERELLQTALQTTLYDTLHLTLVVKQAHWNLVGPNFRSVHLQLDEVYEAATESSDEVAERLTALGMSPNGQGPEVVANTRVQTIAPGFVRDLDAVRLIAERLHQSADDIRDGLAPIEDVDTVTADLLHGVIERFEKQLWMLRAHLIGSSATQTPQTSR